MAVTKVRRRAAIILTGYDVPGYFKSTPYWAGSTGIIYGGSTVAMRQILDGLSKTYLSVKSKCSRIAMMGWWGANARPTIRACTKVTTGTPAAGPETPEMRHRLSNPLFGDARPARDMELGTPGTDKLLRQRTRQWM